MKRNVQKSCLRRTRISKVARISLWSLGLLFLSLGMQCTLTTDDQDDCQSPPSDCPKAEPQEVEVRFHFTISERYGNPILATYSGANIEESHLLRIDTIRREEFGLLLPPGKHAVMAYYLAGPDTLELLDQAGTSVSSNTYCGGVKCYETEEDRVDFRLYDVPEGVGR